jgi:glycerol-3-phosphate dehydrogenase
VGARLERGHQLRALEDGVFDLLVVGGGSVGAGLALEAAALGLRVALVEAADFGAGTSSRSTKLVHGGVRYLERAVRHLDRRELALVREALRERAAFFRVAPFLSRRLGILAPSYGRGETAYLALGLWLYDRLAGPAGLGPTRVLGPGEASAAFPALRRRGLHAAVLYYDGQFDDARLAVLLALSAAARGAVAANYARVTALLREGGRVAGALVRDELTGAELAVRARTVVNAAGPFADAVRRLGEPDAPPLLAVSSGVHLVLRPEALPVPAVGLVIPRTSDGRVLFALPWQGRLLVGTTDRPAEPDARPAVPPADVAYLLRHLNRVLDRPVGPEHVASAWAGLRPLVRDPRRRGTAALVRSHLVVEGPAGLVSALGGKWTTYRVVARDVLRYLARRGHLRLPPLLSEPVPVLGAEGWDPGLPERLAPGLPRSLAAALGARYGTRMAEVLALAGPEAAPLGPEALEAEVRWAARAELAVRVPDVLGRRLRLAFLDREAALGLVPRVAALLGEEHGWDARRRAEEEASARAELLGAI